MGTAELRFTMTDGTERHVSVRHLLNAGYTGRDTEAVRAHVDELADLGVPAPSRTPTLYPLPARLASQDPSIEVLHGRTSGEAEWALVVGETEDDLLLTVASDHSDRDLEVHGVAWGKQAAPNILGDLAWHVADVADTLDRFALRAWVSHGDEETPIQEGHLGQLLPPSYWLDELAAAALLRPGTILLGGTIPMSSDAGPFADRWRVELTDPHGRTSSLSYRVEQLPDTWD